MAGDRKNRNRLKLIIDRTSMLPENRLEIDELTFSEDAPSQVNISKGAHYHEDNVIGRSEPYLSYGYSMSTKVNFTGKLVALGQEKDRNIPMEFIGGALGLTGRFVGGAATYIGIGGSVISEAINQETINRLFGQESSNETALTTFTEVTQKVAWLDALQNPQYDSQGKAYPPPRVWLKFGQNFKKRGVIDSVSFVLQGPWEVRTLLCMQVDCQISFIEVNTAPKSYRDVRNISGPELSEAPDTGFNGEDAIDNARSLAGL